MELTKITDLTRQLDITSRSLRYYEEIGLIKSTRPQFEKYRYYDRDSVERLKQIIILRKMQIPVKDILRIYQSEDMSILVEAFVDRIGAIDREIGTLGELRKIINGFLVAMAKRGIRHISALPLIYDALNEQKEDCEMATYDDLRAASGALANTPDVSIIDLPKMRMLTSIDRQTGTSDAQEFWAWLGASGIPAGLPGRRALFEYQDERRQTIILQKIDEDFANDGPYADIEFAGGLFAVCGAYADDDLRTIHRAMIGSFDDNRRYEVAYLHDGQLRHPTMVETVISPDGQRDRIELFLPVKSRLPDSSLYDPGERIEGVTQAELDAANPILWSKDVAMDSFTPILNPYYRVNEAGEAEFIPYIDKRTLSTNVVVKLPLRVDIEFRVDDQSASFAHGSTEGSLRICYGAQYFGINMNNNADPKLSQEAIAYGQSSFADERRYPKLGRINRGGINRLSWIIGPEHFAVVINDEVRYCGVNLPYMSADLRLQQPQPIIIGSNGQNKIVLRAVRVSQLKYSPKLIVRDGALEIQARRSNNIIPNVHQLITMHYGENYWFNGAAKYVMECHGRPEMDYWFFAGLTGDNLAQVFAFDRFRGDGATDYRMSEYQTGRTFIEDVIERCGYACQYVSPAELAADKPRYVRMLMDSIDRGIPVIHGFVGEMPMWSVSVGYEEYGNALLVVSADWTEPKRYGIEQVLAGGQPDLGWLFVTGKVRDVDIAQIYRDVILDMPRLLSTKTDAYCFGAAAFRAWADEIEGGRYDGMQSEQFDGWFMYTIYVCNLATNASCLAFYETALKLNPDMKFIERLIELHREMGCMWNNGNGTDLEALGGGFNITLEALQDGERRGRIASKLREFAQMTDEIVRVVETFIDTGK